jgi:hypothetical protein
MTGFEIIRLFEKEQTGNLEVGVRNLIMAFGKDENGKQILIPDTLPSSDAVVVNYKSIKNRQ